MRHRNIAATIFAVLLMGSGLCAEVVPGRWEKVDALAADTEIEIKLKTGDRIKCSFESSEPDSLTILEPNGSVRIIPKSAVDTIESLNEYDDSGKDGLTKGLIAGLLSGMAFGAICSGKADSSETAFCFGMGIIYGTGIGAGVGYMADKIHKGHELYYRAR